jgi:hypothetical protein
MRPKAVPPADVPEAFEQLRIHELPYNWSALRTGVHFRRFRWEEGYAARDGSFMRNGLTDFGASA